MATLFTKAQRYTYNKLVQTIYNALELNCQFEFLNLEVSKSHKNPQLIENRGPSRGYLNHA